MDVRRSGILSACRFFTVSLLLALATRLEVRAQEAVSEAIVVRADRLPNAEATAPFSVQVVTRDELKRAPQLRLDDILRSEVPGFNLFRRNSSRTANPTTQGVSLRNFGPNGAGRTLVLLDGIPLNDPFAGYVLWSQVPSASIGNVLVNPGGGAGLFGNSALAGTIYLLSERPEKNAAFAEANVGTRDTYSGSFGGYLVSGGASFSILAERFSTGGYPVLQADQRGPVDNHASADSELLQAGGEFRIAPDSTLRLQARRFHEDRGNGTIGTMNETIGGDLSGLWTTRIPQLEAELEIGTYYQRRKYRSTFSSVNATRDLETPALDQFDVPANAAGGSAVWSMRFADSHRLVVGADGRWIEGETNEAFRRIGDEFTRLRNAGGRQLFIGAFAEETWTMTPSVTVVGGVRADHWQLFDGMRNEFDRGTGAATLSTAFADRSGWSWNGRLGVSASVTQKLTWRAAAYTGFRVPTLNELYRPFRVGNDVTEANAALNPERLLGGETGVEWRPHASIRLASTVFLNRLNDAIGNATIAFGPGTFDPGGFIPEGGVLRQRRNVGVVIAPGAELKAEWDAAAWLTFKATYLWTEPTIHSSDEPAIVGNLLAQTPEHALTGRVEWRPQARWFVTAQARYNDRQFEDDLNSRELAPFVVIDMAASYDFSNAVSAALKLENLFDTEIETGKSADGLVSIGAPRLLTLQLQWRL